MKRLTLLVIDNVKSIVHRGIEFGRYTLLSGSPSSGKTSVLEAIRILFGTAGIEGQRGYGRVLPYMQIGADEMTVAAELAEGDNATCGAFARAYKVRGSKTFHTLTVNETEMDTQEAEAALTEYTGGTAAVFDVRSIRDFDQIAQAVTAGATIDTDAVAEAALLAVVGAVVGEQAVQFAKDAGLTAQTITDGARGKHAAYADYLRLEAYKADGVELYAHKLQALQAAAENDARAAYRAARDAEGAQQEAAATAAGGPTRPLQEIKAALTEASRQQGVMQAAVEGLRATVQRAQKADSNIAECTAALEAERKVHAAATEEIAKLRDELGVRALPHAVDTIDAALTLDLCDKCKAALQKLKAKVKRQTVAKETLQAQEAAAARSEKRIAALEKNHATYTADKAAAQAAAAELATTDDALKQLTARVQALSEEHAAAAAGATERAKREERAQAVETSKARRAVCLRIAEVLQAQAFVAVKAACEPFIADVNRVLVGIAQAVPALNTLGTFTMEYTAGRVRVGLLRNAGMVAWETLGGTEAAILRNVVGCKLLAAAGAPVRLLLDDIAEVGDEALVPFLDAVRGLADACGVQFVFASCHAPRGLEKAVHGLHVISMDKAV